MAGLKSNLEEETQSSGFGTEPTLCFSYLPCGFLYADSWPGGRTWRQGGGIRIDRCHHSGTRVDPGFGMEAFRHADSSDGGGSCILQRRRVDALSYRRQSSISLRRGVGCSRLRLYFGSFACRIPSDTVKNQPLTIKSRTMMKSIQRPARAITRALEILAPQFVE